MSAPENNSDSETADVPESTEHQTNADGNSAEVNDSKAAGESETTEQQEAMADNGAVDASASDDDEGPSDEASAEVELDIDSLAAALATERKRADENWDRVLRMQADIENQRKRSQREVQNARKFALEGMINDLLPVRDSLEMGLAAASQDDADITSIIEGSELTLKMLSQAFEKYNIEEVNPVDQKFNPEFHQAMSMQEIEGRESNTVVNVLQKGYTLNERLLRPALVIVAK